MHARLAGADCLRFAALLSIILFHVALEDTQFARGPSGPTEWFDVLMVASTVFDNRTLAILSFFLLFIRYEEAPYSRIMARRAKRLLLPYFAWMAIYPLLDFGLAAVKGESHAYIADAWQFNFWLSRNFLATTEHLFFLPTLFLATLILPLYKVALPLKTAVALLATASVVRVTAEFLIIGNVYAPTIRDLILLSSARVLEYLPLGVFAFALLKATHTDANLRWRSCAALVLVLVAASILLKPWHLVAILGEGTGRMVWLIAQASFGTVSMCLAAFVVLVLGNRLGKDSPAERWGPILSRRALGIFVLHPFFINTFDTIIGEPEAYALWLVAPKVLFAFVCSFLSTSILGQTKGLRAIV
jgi:surface polysaccharide O-acyltransferase-like enzyme